MRVPEVSHSNLLPVTRSQGDNNVCSTRRYFAPAITLPPPHTNARSAIEKATHFKPGNLSWITKAQKAFKNKRQPENRFQISNGVENQ